MTKTTTLLPIFLTVILDAAGIGLVLPVLPDLFGATAGPNTGMGTTGFAYGFFLSLYALMQFLFAPVFGGLSDRIGRKPILLAAIGGAAVNYAAMAFLPPLWLLFVLRAIAGVTGGSISVASAYIADLSSPEDRATRFGQLSACFGIGFILGPAAGGLLREIGLNWPFAVAAVVAALNLVLCLVALPESRAAEPAKATFDPLSGFRDIGQFRSLLPLLLVCALFGLIGEIGGSVWVFYTHQKFHWTGVTVGVSLTLFGLFHALAQAVLIGPLTRRLGERTALLLGMACDMVSYVGMALLTNGLFVFALIPLFCVAGVGPSVLAAVVSRQVGENRQGQLQGVIASFASLASIIGPTLFLSLYFATRDVFPGLVWIIGAALYLLTLPVILRRSTYG